MQFLFAIARCNFSYVFFSISLYAINSLIKIITYPLYDSNFLFYQLFMSITRVFVDWMLRLTRVSRACLHCDGKLRGLDAGFPAIEAPSNQFCWPRKSKGLRLLAVSRALLSLSVSDGLRPILLMACVCPRILFFFFLGIGFFVYPSVFLVSPAYLCPSLHFQLYSVSIHRNSVWI